MKQSALLVGHVLLWLGFLAGAFVSVAQLENKTAPWQTISWLQYAACAVIGVMGVVLLRSSRMSQLAESRASTTGPQSVLDCLTSVAELVSQLHLKIEDSTCEEVLEFIDEKCEPACLEFADQRQAIADHYGLPAFAAVMTEFASGERYLNRAWSAAADGYVDEVTKALAISDEFMAAAVEKLRQAEADQQT